MPVSTPATQTLDRLSIPYRVFEHPHPPGSLEQAARERGQEPGQVVRSILFRHEQEAFIMVLMAGPGQISWKRVRAHLGVSRLSMANETEVREVTGCQIGTVSPFGLPSPILILADNSVFEPEEISIGCGVRGAAIIMKSSDLQRALGEVEIGLFAV
jgi:Cys-tRNA(Pro) deacylase